MTLKEIVGGSPDRTTMSAGGDGSRQSSDTDLLGARHPGERIAKAAMKLFH